MKTALLTLTLILTSFYSDAQRIKYKDLYVLLRAKNYKDGASFLKAYIVANPEHPNANYQMGIMLEFKIKELDILKEENAIVSRADSAIMYFDKAYTFITPKEVKKHDDDYYEVFKRRNLRSGKFEVILSDVQLDIENRKNNLQVKKNNISSINVKFNNAIISYNQATDDYKKLKSAYHDELSLSLGASDTAIVIIQNIMVSYESALISFNAYKKLKKSFEPTSNDVIITNKPIGSFSKEASQTPDYYAQEVDLYNFSDWGSIQIEKIKEHKEFIEHLIEFDASLETISASILEDSVDMTSDIFKKITLPILKELKSLDPKSLLTDVFQYKISQLNYNSSLINWFNMYADSLDIGLQLDFISKLNNQLEEIEKLETAITEYDKSLFIIRYHKFSEKRYQTNNNFFGYLEKQSALIGKQHQQVDSILLMVKEKDKWGYWKEDAISLSLINDPLLKYNIFYIDSLENRGVQIVGLTKEGDKSTFFFSNVPSSRVIDSLYFSEALIEPNDLSLTEFIVQAESPTIDETIYMIGTQKNKKYELQLIYIHQINGVVWNTPVWLDTTLPPTLRLTDEYIEIMQGDLSTRYNFLDGSLVKD